MKPVIFTLYIFQHKQKIDIRRIGVFPDERSGAIRKAIKNEVMRYSNVDVEAELMKFFLKYVMWRGDYGEQFTKALRNNTE